MSWVVMPPFYVWSPLQQKWTSAQCFHFSTNVKVKCLRKILLSLVNSQLLTAENKLKIRCTTTTKRCATKKKIRIFCAKNQNNTKYLKDVFLVSFCAPFSIWGFLFHHLLSDSPVENAPLLTPAGCLRRKQVSSVSVFLPLMNVRLSEGLRDWFSAHIWHKNLSVRINRAVRKDGNTAVARMQQLSANNNSLLRL